MEQKGTCSTLLPQFVLKDVLYALNDGKMQSRGYFKRAVVLVTASHPWRGSTGVCMNKSPDTRSMLVKDYQEHESQVQLLAVPHVVFLAVLQTHLHSFTKRNTVSKRLCRIMAE